MLTFFLKPFFKGHISIGRITVYGFNAMKFALNIKVSEKYLCVRPWVFENKFLWSPYLYLSPDGTPGSAVFGVGKRFKRFKYVR